jgi:hypothetical protein
VFAIAVASQTKGPRDPACEKYEADATACMPAWHEMMMPLSQGKSAAGFSLYIALSSQNEDDHPDLSG